MAGVMLAGRKAAGVARWNGVPGATRSGQGGDAR